MNIENTGSFLKVPNYNYTNIGSFLTYEPNSDLIFESDKLNITIVIPKSNMKLGIPTNLAEYLQEYLYTTNGVNGTYTRKECDSIFLEAALIGNLCFKKGIPTRIRNTIFGKIQAYFSYALLRCFGFMSWNK